MHSVAAPRIYVALCINLDAVWNPSVYVSKHSAVCECVGVRVNVRNISRTSVKNRLGFLQ